MNGKKAKQIRRATYDIGEHRTKVNRINELMLKEVDMLKGIKTAAEAEAKKKKLSSDDARKLVTQKTFSDPDIKRTRLEINQLRVQITMDNNKYRQIKRIHTRMPK